MKTVLKSLNEGLYNAMQGNPNVYLLGEDILDPYGGAFKVTKGLSSQFPDRVITTPLSEAGFVGIATGMALRGLRPVVEIMFGDFISLITDQILNHAAKFRWMYNNQVQVPLVIRTPMGGYRGYGPTHSQSLEKLFLGIPGLNIWVVDQYHQPGKLLETAILDNQDPLLFVENKLLYSLPIIEKNDDNEFEIYEIKKTTDNPTEKLDEKMAENSWMHLKLRGAPPPTITMVTYGYMTELARRAALILAYDYEIFTEILLTSVLSPFYVEPIIPFIRRTNKIITIEEGNLTLGWGAEIIARVLDSMGDDLRQAKRVAALDLPIPASGVLENLILPNVDRIVKTVLKVV